MTRTPRLESLIEGAIVAELGKFWTALPGRVEAFDQDDCLADVQPMVKRVYLAEDGEYEEERLPQVRFAPVHFPGGPANQLTFPVKVGDLGVLVFTSASLDNFLATGHEVKPFDRRKNTLSDAVFFPGLHSMVGPPSDYSNDAVVLKAEQIRLGSVNANQEAILGGDFVDLLKGFVDDLVTFAGSVPTPNGSVAFGSAATAFKNALDLVLSDKVLLE